MSHNTICETVKDLQVTPIIAEHRRSRRLLLHVMMLVIAVMAMGCCSFERNWKCCQSYAHSGNDLAGCWEGRWHSDMNGHEGTLRAIITKQDVASYHAHFKATFAVIIPYEFQIPITTTTDGGGHSFQSQADLGWLAGGTYSYNGQADACEFVAYYCAENGDHGTFTMRRLCCSQDCDSCDSWRDDCCAPAEPPPAQAAQTESQESDSAYQSEGGSE